MLYADISFSEHNIYVYYHDHCTYRRLRPGPFDWYASRQSEELHVWIKTHIRFLSQNLVCVVDRQCEGIHDKQPPDESGHSASGARWVKSLETMDMAPG